MSTTTVYTTDRQYSKVFGTEPRPSIEPCVGEGTSDPPAQDVSEYIERSAEDNTAEGSSLEWKDYQTDKHHQSLEESERSDPGYQRTKWDKDDLKSEDIRIYPGSYEWEKWRRMEVLNKDRIPKTPIQPEQLRTPTETDAGREYDDKMITVQQVGERLGCSQDEINRAKECIERADVEDMGSHKNNGTAALCMLVLVTYRSRKMREYARTKSDNRIDFDDRCMKPGLIEEDEDFVQICLDRRPSSENPSRGTLCLLDGDNESVDPDGLESAIDTLQKNIRHREDCDGEGCDCIPARGM